LANDFQLFNDYENKTFVVLPCLTRNPALKGVVPRLRGDSAWIPAFAGMTMGAGMTVDA